MRSARRHREMTPDLVVEVDVARVARRFRLARHDSPSASGARITPAMACGQLLPARSLDGELLAAGRGEPIDAHALPILGDVPIRRDPFLSLEAVQGGVERSRVDLQRLVGVGANHLRDAVSVTRPPAQRLQDDEVEGALKQLDPRQRLLRHDGAGRRV